MATNYTNRNKFYVPTHGFHWKAVKYELDFLITSCLKILIFTNILRIEVVRDAVNDEGTVGRARAGSSSQSLASRANANAATTTTTALCLRYGTNDSPTDRPTEQTQASRWNRYGAGPKRLVQAQGGGCQQTRGGGCGQMRGDGCTQEQADGQESGWWQHEQGARTAGSRRPARARLTASPAASNHDQWWAWTTAGRATSTKNREPAQAAPRPRRSPAPITTTANELCSFVRSFSIDPSPPPPPLPQSQHHHGRRPRGQRPRRMPLPSNEGSAPPAISPAAHSLPPVLRCVPHPFNEGCGPALGSSEHELRPASTTDGQQAQTAASELHGRLASTTNGQPARRMASEPHERERRPASTASATVHG
ncbi:hypothetical protein BJ912DRAFT_1049508 [Pholiota molesta]|nr:hypothetical protein BJ912DRAFT_1049508 [Pholiota molesta]